MRIINRKGDSEEIVLDKITSRIKKLCYNLDSTVIDPVVISTKVCSMIRDGITTIELDELTANICMNLSLEHPDWGTLGSRIAINNHQKNVRQSFSEAINNLYNHRDVHDNHSPLVSKEVWEFSQNPEMGEFLRSTKEKILVEANPYDNIWGIGIRECQAKGISPDKWPGKNLLGKCLMKVREMI